MQHAEVAARDPAVVMVVEDNRMSRSLFQELVEGEGLRCVAFPDAESALSSFEAVRPSVVLLDVQLPRMSGLEMARQLRTRDDSSEISVVAVSAYAMQEDIARAKNAGCNVYLTKPISLKNLRAVIHSLVRRGGVHIGTGAVKV